MNRSGIEWCDHTWNPITGCLHNCAYCYARRMSKRFSGNIRLNKMAKGDYRTITAEDGSCELYVLDEPMFNETGKPLVYPFGFNPTFHKYRMNNLDQLKMGNNVFVGAMADVFGEWVPDEWIDEIIQGCVERPQHNYLFLTKNPQRYMHYELPGGKDNMWYGTSITNADDLHRIDFLPVGCKTFLSVEPLLEDIEPGLRYCLGRDVDWMIIGAETGSRKEKVVPQREWIHRLVLTADTAGVPVFMKESLLEIVGEDNMRRDFPKELKRKELSTKMKEKLYERCAKCKKELRKNEMIALLARSTRGIQPKQYAYLCKSCFKESCENMGIEVPKLKNMENFEDE